MNLIETVRSTYLRHQLNKISASWEDRRRVLLSSIPKSRDKIAAADILGIGDRLSEAFQLPQLSNTRKQSALSSGGSAWQVLVSYYLNLCLAGTDAIALSGKFVPSCMKSALKVTHSSSASTQLNSDVDLLVMNVRGVSGIPLAEGDALKQLSKLSEIRFPDSSAIVLQTKTNWNDNAQVPMLWNLIYNVALHGKIPENGVSVGSGSFHIRDLAGFGYGFVTVPTQKGIESKLRLPALL